MEIPRFWEKEEADETTPDGDSMELTCWGWSKEGPAEARAKAGELLRELRHRLRQGAEPDRYAYGSRLVREEILRELPDAEGGLAAVVTRNVYGCEVLNTAGAMFIDVDLPPPRWSLGQLFGRRPSDPAEEHVKALRQIIETDPWRAGRIYRTAAGLRLLITDRLYEPASADAEQLMTTCGADPAFVRLCRVQKSFRARLTPKPWRCGAARPPGRHPREDRQIQREFDRWLARYETASAAWSTCQLLAEAGSGRVNEEIAPLVRLHDEATRCGSGLPLA
jgi:hypothetical protein